MWRNAWIFRRYEKIKQLIDKIRKYQNTTHTSMIENRSIYTIADFFFLHTQHVSMLRVSFEMPVSLVSFKLKHTWLQNTSTSHLLFFFDFTFYFIYLFFFFFIMYTYTQSKCRRKLTNFSNKWCFRRIELTNTYYYKWVYLTLTWKL